MTQADTDHVDLRSVEESVASALVSLRPAHVRHTQAVCPVGVNRDIETAEGWWHGADPDGFADPVVPVLRLDDGTGFPIAVLATVSVQSAVLNDSTLSGGGRAVSPDLGGAAAVRIEREWPGTTAFVMTGTAGDQAPALTAYRCLLGPDGSPEEDDLHEAAFPLVGLLGERLGTQVVRAARGAVSSAVAAPVVVRSTIDLPGQEMPRDVHAIHPAHDHAFTPTGKTSPTPWVVLRLGEAVVVGVQAELSASTGTSIRERSPFTTAVVVTLVDGGAKYTAAASAYDRITYEAMNSRFARGSAETLTEAVLTSLSELAVRTGN